MPAIVNWRAWPDPSPSSPGRSNMTQQPSPKLLRPFVALLFAIATIPVVAAPSFAQEAKRVVKTYRARPGILGSFERKYVVHLPSNYNPAEKLPLVMVLHGCFEQ